MENRDRIQVGLDYIENNLKTEITAEELAKCAGFSLFHYYRVFESLVGMPVGQYITRRRLLWSACEIVSGAKITDTELLYGFDTHAGFFKAFRREFGCSPTEYAQKYRAGTPCPVQLTKKEHLMLTEKKLREILKNWNKGNADIAPFYYESSGSRSDSQWIVDQNFLLRLSANPAALRKHILVSRAMEKVGLEAALPECSIHGTEIVVFGEWYACLVRRVGGRCILAREIYRGNYDESARLIGEAIGRLHCALKQFDDDPGFDNRDLWQQVSEWAMPAVRNVMDLPDSFYRRFSEQFGALYPSLPNQVIHRDPTPSDILFQNGKLSGFVEFEMTERNIRLFDPCYAATAILSESFDASDTERLEQWIGVFRAILDGYDSICVLTAEEKRAVVWTVFSIQMICIAYFSQKKQYAPLRDTNVAMLKWLIQNESRLTV